MKFFILFLSFFGMLNIAYAQAWENIHIDQFGYTSEMKKVAILSDPQQGFNASNSYTPGNTIQVISVSSGISVFSDSPTLWNNGATHIQSGDKGWWFDFSDVQEIGEYYIYDPTNDIASATFWINDNVYNPILKTAMRMYYHNRCNQVKSAIHSGADWTDTEGFPQDAQSRYIFDQNNTSLEKDLTGGWYDAGDYNKYIAFVYESMHHLLWAYQENPAVFTDNYNIPESGNGIPDILDEIKWELDWMIKMQNPDGTVHNKMGHKAGDPGGSDSPPSSNTGTRYYGPTCTSSTLTNAGVLSHAAIVFKEISGMETYATLMEGMAEDAWDAVISNLNSESFDINCDQGEILSGDADRNVAEQLGMGIVASVYLYELTGKAEYLSYFTNNYTDFSIYSNGYFGPYTTAEADAILHMADNLIGSANPSLVSAVRAPFITAATNNWNNFFGLLDDDLYRSQQDDAQYHWGSNTVKAHVGSMNHLAIKHNLTNQTNQGLEDRASDQLHYFHGVNALNTVMITNMYDDGAESSANEMYHSWFGDGTAYDNALTSTSGPPPGFVVGGVNKNYGKDGCCPGSCGGYGNGICQDPTFDLVDNLTSEPVQKRYADINTSWPINSWEVTEPSQVYQSAYVRLLSRSIPTSQVILSFDNDEDVFIDIEESIIYLNTTNPITQPIQVNHRLDKKTYLQVSNSLGQVLINNEVELRTDIDLSDLAAGTYFIIAFDDSDNSTSKKIIIY